MKKIKYTATLNIDQREILQSPPNTVQCRNKQNMRKLENSETQGGIGGRRDSPHLIRASKQGALVSDEFTVSSRGLLHETHTAGDLGIVFRVLQKLGVFIRCRGRGGMNGGGLEGDKDGK